MKKVGLGKEVGGKQEDEFKKGRSVKRKGKRRESHISLEQALFSPPLPFALHPNSSCCLSYQFLITRFTILPGT